MIENIYLAKFLSIFLITFPILVFLICLIPKGIFWAIEYMFQDETIKNFFHHHFHYKAKRD